MSAVWIELRGTGHRVDEPGERLELAPTAPLDAVVLPPGAWNHTNTLTDATLAREGLAPVRLAARELAARFPREAFAVRRGGRYVIVRTVAS